MYNFRAFSGEFLDVVEQKELSSCLGVVAETARDIATNELTVSAVCDVDEASGLPEYPIQGHIKFTQPVTVYTLQLYSLGDAIA